MRRTLFYAELLNLFTTEEKVGQMRDVNYFNTGI